MELRKLKLFKFAELSEDSKASALENLRESEYQNSNYFEFELDQILYELSDLKNLGLKSLESIQHLIDSDQITDINMYDYSLGNRGSYAKFKYRICVEEQFYKFLDSYNLPSKHRKLIESLYSMDAIILYYDSEKSFYTDYKIYLDKYFHIKTLATKFIADFDTHFVNLTELIEDTLESYVLNYWRNAEEYFCSDEYLIENVIECGDHDFLEDGRIYTY